MNNKITLTLLFTMNFFVIFGVNAQTYKLELEPVKFVIPGFSEQYLEREVSLAPDEYELAEKLRILLNNNDFQQVKSELDTYYDVELSPALLMIKAQVYFSFKAYNQTIHLYQLVLKRKPQLVRAHEELGVLYLITENFIQARQHFAKAIAYGSNNASVHGHLGYLNLQQHGGLSAVYAYQKAFSLEPHNSQWQQGLLTSLVQAKMHQPALALLNELIAQDKNNQSYWLTKAAIHIEQDTHERALQSLEFALLLGDIPQQNLLIMINLHFEQAQFDRAVALLKTHVKSQRLVFEDIRNYLLWLNQANRWEDSQWLITNLSEQSALSAQNKSLMLSTQAQILEAKNRHTEALAHYQNALDTDPNNQNALLSFAHLLLQQKHYIKAEQMYIRAEAFEALQLQALLGRAQLYINTDDLKAAYQLLIDAKRAYPNTLRIQDKINLLANIIDIQNTNTL
ncbi:tetratricopeptide repeat protein [Pseudoalteromonas luteoviolacea]|uniref:Uncharacterized protein n=1 Tax=Pseudoalteromonas luteoviolacea S4054 TaxID=1129367 RepID=A0A0F6AE29_9GAMM|nr:tetratricopeptide repeat protein [Pseudoalteromonas luteoviolacea]AOT07984.1 hypothetical protein S4054249_09065 [Pseudoalteromonas luteoviolacea]AOT12900.1 hypothetical protein S40542_09065 [Pseudoalteromonas luteoviolacea]AOT17813.1 hypothetical protein S4054_09060 [Pseudoalteromonas luteoviolacea]KKE84467.1 hypothetical protein N479_09505 [Pseudoalteromonas luteoviolacea S4054]KZN71842.1 hypothetical protein N481_18045 [Pseudoalteromonas luteoviolacea S4047-1]